MVLSNLMKSSGFHSTFQSPEMRDKIAHGGRQVLDKISQVCSV